MIIHALRYTKSSAFPSKFSFFRQLKQDITDQYTQFSATKFKHHATLYIRLTNYISINSTFFSFFKINVL